MMIGYRDKVLNKANKILKEAIVILEYQENILRKK